MIAAEMDGHMGGATHMAVGSSLSEEHNLASAIAPHTNAISSGAVIAKTPAIPSSFKLNDSIATPQPVKLAAAIQPDSTTATSPSIAETGAGSQSGSAYSYSQVASAVDAPLTQIESIGIPGWVWAVGILALVYFFLD